MSGQPQRDWTIIEALDWCTRYLEEHDDPNPRLSAQWLLSEVTDLSRTEVYAYFDRLLTNAERTQLREKLQRRGAGEPLQQVLGEAPFRHLSIGVCPDVLIPRPETEGLVELVLEHLSSQGPDRNGAIGSLASILDIGTGSGCIALALASEYPEVAVTATDLSPEALSVARENAEKLGLLDRIEFIESDGFDALAGRTFDVIVSNPPYVPSAMMRLVEDQVLAHEPRLALDGGLDGLDLFRRILDGTIDHLHENGALFVELDECNAPQAADLAVQLNRYAQVVVKADLSGRDRYVVATGFSRRGGPHHEQVPSC